MLDSNHIINYFKCKWYTIQLKDKVCQNELKKKQLYTIYIKQKDGEKLGIKWLEKIYYTNTNQSKCGETKINVRQRRVEGRSIARD